MITTNYMYFILTGAALLLSWLAFRPCLHIARKYNIVDQPDKRKLQDYPVPVFGGLTVVIGMLIPLLIVIYYYQANELWYAITAIVVLWLIGVIDDIHGLSPSLRFILEVGLIWVLLWQPMNVENGYMINNLGGLFGRHDISHFTAIPLTLIAGVGIINSINLIDGVDGYSSGYGIVANTLFAILFIWVGNIPMGLFALVTAASLIPFYLHNVFGQTSKMYIGDGGSLVIGFAMAYNTLAILDINSPCHALEKSGISIVALSLAILCIPVFDTLRVMVARLCNGCSPFMPDKTHLHHRFIALGFSHAGTSACIILTNILIVALWYLSYRIGCSINVQVIVVVICGLLATCGFYYGSIRWEKSNNAFHQFLCRVGKWSHFERKGNWLTIQHLIDKI